MPGPKRLSKTVVQAPDRLALDMQRVAGSAAEALNLLPFARGRLVSVKLTAGTPLVVAHKLGTPARCFPVSLMYSATPNGDDLYAPELWVKRVVDGPSLASLVSPAGNFSVGCRFTLQVPRGVAGIRFAGFNGAAGRTYRCKLWNATSGALLASKDIAVPAFSTKVAGALFDLPVACTPGISYTVSIWDTSGGVYIHSNVDTMAGIVPVVFGSGITLSAMNLWAAGDARPVNVSAVETYWVEPILSPGETNVAEDIDQAGIDPRTHLRLLASSSGTVDLWFYPKASRIIPSGATQSP